MEMTAQSVISLAPSTKEQVEIFANQLIDDVEQGVTNPLALHIQIIAFEKSLEKVKEAIRPDVLREAEKHNQKAFDHMGCKVEIKEVGVKYDYTACGDQVYNELTRKMNELKAQMKEREGFLKHIPDGNQTVVDESTGEVMSICKPIKTSTTAPVITMK